MTLFDTPEDQAAWDALLSRQEAFQLELYKIDKAKQQMASRMFEKLLRDCKWTVVMYRRDDELQLHPVDREARKRIGDIVSTALKLGYRDSFVIHDGVVRLDGYISGGDLTINIWPGLAGEDVVANEFKMLQVDVNITEFTAHCRTEALTLARLQFERAREWIETLENRPKKSS